MRISQREVRGGMIERLTIELNDIAASPLVIAMAMVAILLCGIRPSPVKAHAGRPVRGDLLVAGQAQLCLRFAREWLVAFAAIILQLRVPLDDRPGKHELFEQILRARARRQDSYENACDRRHA